MKTYLKKHLIGFACLVMAVFGLYSCKLFGPKDPPKPQAQGIVVMVKDMFTKKPIPNATVKWSKSELSGSGSTDKDGIYRKDGMADGKYLVIGTANDYKLERAGKDMTVEVGAMTSETFELTPETLEITPKNVTFADGEKSKTVYFKNKHSESSITLSIEVPQKDDWVKISNPTLTIPAGSQKDITVTVDTKGRGFGSYNSTVTLNFTINGRPDNDVLNIYMNIANPQAPSISTDVPTGISQTSADVRCTVTNIGGSTVTDRGIYVSENSDPKASNSQKVSMGPGGIGSFVATAKGLKSGGKYFARGYSINSFGEGLGEVREFVTSVEPTPPTLAMNPVLDKDVSLTTAVVSATVTNNGGTNITESGFLVSNANPPTMSNGTKVPANADPNGKMSANLTGLTQGTNYFVQAYAINGLGANKSGLSNVETFKTQSPSTPAKLTTGAPTNITETSARIQANLTELGSSPIVQSGFCWSRQNAEPELKNSDKNELGGRLDTGQLLATISNLKKGSLYYIRAYVTNKDGQTYYGNVQTLFTKEQGLVAYYPFNGDASDISGNGNNAISTAQPSQDRFANEKSAYDLNTGIVQIQNQTVGRFVGDFTYSFQVKINSSTFKGSKKVLFAKGSDSDCSNGEYWSGFMVFTEPVSSTLNLFVNGADGKKDDVKLLNSSIMADEWHHVALSKTGKTIKVFLDGSYINQVDVTTSTVGFGRRYPGGTEGSLTISGFPYSSTNCQNPEKIIALMDNFRLYSYGLSDADVADLYQREK
ncbi:LamG-like jellyroll fold domain-containing protein [Runella salmonicolor]|uniref:Fibronectin type-III domain-containing protein n=1 Tax=Runella salmonicolor TaxID=2950278 RepID=A0ABT1FWU8_9BACT|nr:LamG-like jellyroll fold domain-containing protein [Runella salmonicolor]MCP1386245.1 hypothetical protein [Runella salmonicolor]